MICYTSPVKANVTGLYGLWQVKRDTARDLHDWGAVILNRRLSFCVHTFLSVMEVYTQSVYKTVGKL
jgi:hypothetical protein